MFAQATNNQWPEYWLHDLSPFIIRFSENFGLRWYGMAYVLGFLAAYGLLAFYYKKGRSPWDADQQATAFWAIILGVVVGGRLGYMLFYDWGNFMRNPLIIIRVWEGGMASHGGFVWQFAGRESGLPAVARRPFSKPPIYFVRCLCRESFLAALQILSMESFGEK